MAKKSRVVKTKDGITSLVPGGKNSRLQNGLHRPGVIGSTQKKDYQIRAYDFGVQFSFTGTLKISTTFCKVKCCSPPLSSLFRCTSKITSLFSPYDSPDFEPGDFELRKRNSDIQSASLCNFILEQR